MSPLERGRRPAAGGAHARPRFVKWDGLASAWLAARGTGLLAPGSGAVEVGDDAKIVDLPEE
jgi:hypothetical protein